MDTQPSLYVSAGAAAPSSEQQHQAAVLSDEAADAGAVADDAAAVKQRSAGSSFAAMQNYDHADSSSSNRPNSTKRDFHLPVSSSSSTPNNSSSSTPNNRSSSSSRISSSGWLGVAGSSDSCGRDSISSSTSRESSKASDVPSKAPCLPPISLLSAIILNPSVKQQQQQNAAAGAFVRSSRQQSTGFVQQEHLQPESATPATAAVTEVPPSSTAASASPAKLEAAAAAAQLSATESPEAAADDWEGEAEIEALLEKLDIASSRERSPETRSGGGRPCSKIRLASDSDPATSADIPAAAASAAAARGPLRPWNLPQESHRPLRSAAETDGGRGESATLQVPHIPSANNTGHKHHDVAHAAARALLQPVQPEGVSPSVGEEPAIQEPARGPSEGEEVKGSSTIASAGAAAAFAADPAAALGPAADTAAPELSERGDSGDSEAAMAKARLVEKLRCFKGGFPPRLRCRIWKALLDVTASGEPEAQQLAEGIADTPLDEPNQRVIRSDVERTRASLALFREAENRRMMEKILTFYCKSHNIKYKQGLNELLAPFLYLRCADSGFGNAEVFLCFSAFVRRFLPSMFSDDDFTALQCSFHHFKLLLLYHDPTLATFLEEHFATPELYVTPWFLTLFSSKVHLPVLFVLWDWYFLESDSVFFCFLSLAILVNNRGRLLLTEISQLPETLTKLSIHSIPELSNIWELAKELRSQTPLSFAHIFSASQTGGSQPYVENLQELESERAFFMLPQEVLNHAYGRSSEALSPISSADTRRSCNLYGGPSATPGGPPEPVGPRWKLLLLDLRPEWLFENGRLAPAIHVDVLGDWRQTVSALAGAVDPATLLSPTNAEEPNRSSGGNSVQGWGPLGSGAPEARRLPRRRGARLLRTLKWRGHHGDSTSSSVAEPRAAAAAAATSEAASKHGDRSAAAAVASPRGSVRAATVAPQQSVGPEELQQLQQEASSHTDAETGATHPSRCMSDPCPQLLWENPGGSSSETTSCVCQIPEQGPLSTDAAAASAAEPACEPSMLGPEALLTGEWPGATTSPPWGPQGLPGNVAVAEGPDGGAAAQQPTVAAAAEPAEEAAAEQGNLFMNRVTRAESEGQGEVLSTTHRGLSLEKQQQQQEQQRQQQDAVKMKGNCEFGEGLPEPWGSPLRHSDVRDNTSTTTGGSVPAATGSQSGEGSFEGNVGGPPEPDNSTEALLFCCKSLTPEENRRAYLEHRVQVPSHHICLLTEDGAMTAAAAEIYDFLTREMALRWVSFVRGGYAACHWLATQQQLELVDHTPSACTFCHGYGQKQPHLQQLQQQQLWLGAGSSRLLASWDWTSAASSADTPSETALSCYGQLPYGASSSLTPSRLQQQQQQQGSSGSGRHSNQGLNFGGILGAWRRLSSARSPRGSSSKGRKSVAAAAAATDDAATPGGAHDVLTEASSPAEGTPLSRLCLQCKKTDSTNSGNRSRHRASSDGKIYFPPLLRRPSSREGNLCTACGAPCSSMGAAGTPAEARGGSDAAHKPVGASPTQLLSQHASSLLSLPTHHVVLFRTPFSALQAYLKAPHVRRFPCFIEAVLQPPPHLWLHHQATLREHTDEVSSPSQVLPRVVYEAQQGQGDTLCSSSTSFAQEESPLVASASMLASLCSIAPRSSMAFDPAMSLILRDQSFVERPQRRDQQQQRQHEQQASLMESSDSFKQSIGHKSSGAAGPRATQLSLSEGYEHLDSWVFNAPDHRPCEIIVTPTRLVLVSALQEDGPPEQQQQQQQHHRTHGFPCSCAECQPLVSGLQLSPKWQPVGELLGIPDVLGDASDSAEAPMQQHKETKQDSQQQQNGEVQEELVDFYSSMELEETHKITSKKSDTKLLCFYFNATKTQPLMILRFPDDTTAKGCIDHVRKMYRAYRTRRHEQQQEQQQLQQAPAAATPGGASPAGAKHPAP